MRTIYKKGISLQERRRMNLKRYKERHPERVASSNKKWSIKNKDKIANYRKINKESYQKYKAQYYMDRKEQIRQRVVKRKMKLYGSDINVYNYLCNLQENKCKICLRENTAKRHGKYLFIDHCHITNKFRGLICHQCNMMLGNANDNIETLLSAIKYLSEFKQEKNNTSKKTL